MSYTTERTDTNTQIVAITMCDPVSGTATGLTRWKQSVIINLKYMPAGMLIYPAVGEQWYAQRYMGEWRLTSRVPFQDAKTLAPSQPGDMHIGSTGTTTLHGSGISTSAPITSTAPITTTGRVTAAPSPPMLGVFTLPMNGGNIGMPGNSWLTLPFNASSGPGIGTYFTLSQTPNLGTINILVTGWYELNLLICCGGVAPGDDPTLLWAIPYQNLLAGASGGTGLSESMFTVPPLTANNNGASPRIAYREKLLLNAGTTLNMRYYLALVTKTTLAANLSTGAVTPTTVSTTDGVGIDSDVLYKNRLTLQYLGPNS